MKRALTFQNILDAKILTFDFTGEWFEAFGQPQRAGVWFIYGDSGHGKTTFLLMLMRELAKFDKILFLPYEEGEVNKLLQKAIERLGLTAINNRVIVSNETIKEMETRLEKRNSPNIAIIDSLNVSGIKNVKQVSRLREKFPHKTFIYTGWAEGKLPKGNIGKDVLYYANQKIFIEGYRAFSRGRSFGKKQYFTIWEEESKKYFEYK